MSVECFLSVTQNILTVCFLTFLLHLMANVFYHLINGKRVKPFFLLNLQQNVQSMSPEFTIRPPLTVIN